MNKLRKIIKAIIGLLILLIIWQLSIILGKYDSSLMPSPFDVFLGIKELITKGILLSYISISLLRFAIGYSLAVILGITLGLLFGWFYKLWEIFDPIIQILRTISPIAWFPIIVLWFGIGDLPAIVIIFIAAFYPILLSTVNAVHKVDQVYLKVAKNFEVKQSAVLSKIIFPAVFPHIASGLHIAIGSAWVFLVAGEMIGVQSGLGFLIVDARNNLRTDLVLAGIVLIGILGFVLDRLIKKLEKRIGTKWGIAFYDE